MTYRSRPPLHHDASSTRPLIRVNVENVDGDSDPGHEFFVTGALNDKSGFEGSHREHAKVNPRCCEDIRIRPGDNPGFVHARAFEQAYAEAKESEDGTNEEKQVGRSPVELFAKRVKNGVAMVLVIQNREQRNPDDPPFLTFKMTARQVEAVLGAIALVRECLDRHRHAEPVGESRQERQFFAATMDTLIERDRRAEYANDVLEDDDFEAETPTQNADPPLLS